MSVLTSVRAVAAGLRDDPEFRSMFMSDLFTGVCAGVVWATAPLWAQAVLFGVAVWFTSAVKTMAEIAKDLCDARYDDLSG